MKKSLFFFLFFFSLLFLIPSVCATSEYFQEYNINISESDNPLVQFGTYEGKDIYNFDGNITFSYLDESYDRNYDENLFYYTIDEYGGHKNVLVLDDRSTDERCEINLPFLMCRDSELMIWIYYSTALHTLYSRIYLYHETTLLGYIIFHVDGKIYVYDYNALKPVDLPSTAGRLPQKNQWILFQFQFFNPWWSLTFSNSSELDFINYAYTSLGSTQTMYPYLFRYPSGVTVTEYYPQNGTIKITTEEDRIGKMYVDSLDFAYFTSGRGALIWGADEFYFKRDDSTFNRPIPRPLFFKTVQVEGYKAESQYLINFETELTTKYMINLTFTTDINYFYSHNAKGLVEYPIISLIFDFNNNKWELLSKGIISENLVQNNQLRIKLICLYFNLSEMNEFPNNIEITTKVGVWYRTIPPFIEAINLLTSILIYAFIVFIPSSIGKTAFGKNGFILFFFIMNLVAVFTGIVPFYFLIILLLFIVGILYYVEKRKGEI